MKILIALSIILIAGVCTHCSEIDRPKIYWVDSKEYMQRIKTLKISPDEARVLLKKKAHLLNRDIFVDGTLDAVIDNYFLFSYMIGKSSTPLQGYYVNGLTGEIEFRKSKINIKLGEKYLPDNAYIEIEKW